MREERERVRERRGKGEKRRERFIKVAMYVH